MGKALLLVLALIVGLVFVSGCVQQNKSEVSSDNTTQLPNPASKYCIEQGNNLTIRTNADGSQTGYCIFANGTECEEWKYFRGEC